MKTNAITVDVEDFFAICMRDLFGRDRPVSEAVGRCTRRVIELFAESNIRGTFFVLGEVAAAEPQLLRDIATGGHELGVHGFSHRQIFKLSPEEFAREVGDARKLIEDVTGRAVSGHRAPAFSIMPETKWALETLAEAGFRYDSSVYPCAARRYGWGDFNKDIHVVNLPGGRSIVEAPMSTARLFGYDRPACGGGYLRHFPYGYTVWALRRVQRCRPAIIYMHPYELDLEPVPAELAGLLAKSKLKRRLWYAAQRHGRGSVERKIKRLLADFRFAPLGEVIEQVVGPSPVES